MSLLDSRTQNRKRSRETSDVFDSVFSFLMDFADQAETMVPQPKRGPVVTDEVHADTEDALESGDDGNVIEMFDKLPVRDKEELLKDVFGEIVGNMLDKLPEDGKETFLVRCLDRLLPKLPGKSQRVIEIKVKDASSQSQEAFLTRGAQESPSPFPNLFPRDDLVPTGIQIRCQGTGANWEQGNR
ncbi:hypothetical protein NL676_004761 [Syzygium grande]|nr:hypothetical protein NL676_004761 [Syzygium grande]